MKRRGNDEGTVYYSEADQCWIAQMPPDPRGKRPKRRAKTQKEALAKLREMQQAERQGMNLAAKRMTLNMLLDEWMETMQHNLKAKTIESYEFIGKQYIRPALGTCWVDELTPRMIQVWINELTGKHSPTVVRNAFYQLRAVLEEAVDSNLLMRNPAAKRTIPDPPAFSRRPPERAHVLRWLEHTREHRLGGMYLTAALLGLRIGELSGLSWRHYDQTARTLRIEQQVQEIDGKRHITTVKNEIPRTLPVPSLLADRLAWQWNLLQRERDHADWEEHDYIFPSERGTALMPSNINRHLRIGQASLDPPLPHWSMHQFRHFTATRLTELGVSEHVIGGILGHTPGRNVTRRYAQVTIESMRQVLDDLASDLLPKGVI